MTSPPDTIFVFIVVHIAVTWCNALPPLVSIHSNQHLSAITTITLFSAKVILLSTWLLIVMVRSEKALQDKMFADGKKRGLLVFQFTSRCARQIRRLLIVWKKFISLLMTVCCETGRDSLIYMIFVM